MSNIVDTSDEKPSRRLWWGVGGIIAVLMISGIIWQTARMAPATSPAPARAAETAQSVQIYPNYEFPEGINQIKVPLIPSHHVLPREAGGWVMTPGGSRYLIDHKVPVVFEDIDGQKKPPIESKQAAWVGVEPGNATFRLYGQEGEYATIMIKRGVY